MKVTFVSGNPGKVKALTHWLGRELDHHDLDLDELQELDPVKVVEHKARLAFETLKSPVLIEDVSLVFNVLGRLPGTYIKWFLKDAGLEKCCSLLDGFTDRSAVAQVIYCLYDGQKMHFFKHQVAGSVPKSPRGDNGFGWDPIFVPDGSDKTYAEMDMDELAQFAVRPPAVKKLKEFLDN